MPEEFLIRWDEVVSLPSSQSLVSKADFKSKTSVFGATRGSKLTALDSALGAYGKSATWDNLKATRDAFEAWRKDHGGASGYRDDRRNGSQGMQNLAAQLKDFDYITLTPAEFAGRVASRAPTLFTRLSTVVGDDKALAFYQLIAMPFRYDQQTGLREHLERVTASELAKIQSAKRHVNNLAALAKSCLLGKSLLSLPPVAYKASGDALSVATAWVTGGSMTLGGKDDSGVRQELTRLTGLPRDWSSIALAESINQAVAGDAGKKVRKPHNEAPYASSVGGRHVLEHVFTVARTFRPTNRLQWWNYSLFLFGAMVRAHGFGDGNGRTARVYAAAVALQKATFMTLSRDQSTRSPR